MACHRRDLLRSAAIAAGLVLVRGSVTQAASPSSGGLSADDVLRQLLDGNQRFVKGETTSPRRAPGDFRPLAEGQRPGAVIVGCADSRVPPELRPGDRLDNAIRANVMIGVETLQNLQPIMAPAVKRGRVKVVGAVYDLRTGGVTLAV